jgi:hypothetical protein
MNKTVLYIPIMHGGLANTFDNNVFPNLAKVYPAFDLSFDSEGAPVITEDTNASFDKRIRTHHLKPGFKIWETERDCANAAGKIWELISDPTKLFHCPQLILDPLGTVYLADLIPEVTLLGQALDAQSVAAGKPIAVRPEGQIITKERLLNYFQPEQ